LKLDMVKQSLPFLIICGIGEVFAGTIFGHMKDLFVSYPGLIVLMPAVIGMRGNIQTTLGSRLSSSVHLGLIEPGHVLQNPETHENIYAALSLSLIMAVITSAVAYTSSRSVGLETISLISLILITVVSALISSVILTTITISIVVFAFAKGLDPDNVTAPILTTVGDIITIFCIYFTVLVLGYLGVIW